MTTLLERVRWAVDHDGRTLAEIAKDAGFKSRSHISVLMGRLKDDPTSGIEAATVTGLARATGVSASWLLTGDGDALGGGAASERTVEPDDRYPARAEATALLDGAVARESITALRTRRLRSDEDPGLDYWCQELLALDRRRRAALEAQASGQSAQKPGTLEDAAAAFAKRTAEREASPKPPPSGPKPVAGGKRRGK